MKPHLALLVLLPLGCAGDDASPDRASQQLAAAGSGGSGGGAIRWCSAAVAASLDGVAAASPSCPSLEAPPTGACTSDAGGVCRAGAARACCDGSSVTDGVVCTCDEGAWCCTVVWKAATYCCR